MSLRALGAPTAAQLIDEMMRRVKALPPGEKQQLDELLEEGMGRMLWVPNPGPQTEAYYCQADELYYGGAGGGGKTTLLCGLAVNEHYDVHLFRREATQLRGLVKELTKIVGNRDGLNSAIGVWRLPTGQTIELAGIKDEEGADKWQGREADLKGFDEICHFTRSQYRFIVGWNRSTRPGQRCRVVATGNPPMTAQGLWVIQEWAAWLDETYPDPADPGELRWPVRAMDGNDEREIFFRTEEEAMRHLATLDSAPRDDNARLIPPRSRTFIAAYLEDNPELMRSGYSAVIEAMPTEVREALKGSFRASNSDQASQTIPTQWIVAAQERWRPEGYKEFAMSTMAFDPAGGGRDSAELAWRYGPWYAPLVSARGPETADGSAAAARIIAHRRDSAPVVIDAGGGAGHGFGGTTIMRLKDNGIVVSPFNGVSPSTARSRDGLLRFANKRAECWWKFREELNPDQEGGSVIALPPDPELRADLAAPTYEVTARGILIEDKDKIRKRIGRSPGKGDAVVMCWSEGQLAVKRALRAQSGKERQKFATMDSHHQRVRRRNAGNTQSASSSPGVGSYGKFRRPS
jgi:hypothetical protein